MKTAARAGGKGGKSMIVCILLIMIGKALGMPALYWGLLLVQIVCVWLRAAIRYIQDEE